MSQPTISAIGLLVAIVSAVWVGADASQRDFSRDGFADRPWKWVLGTLLLWIIVFPLYLARRNRAPRIDQKRATSASRAILPVELQSGPRAETHTTTALAAPPAGWYADPDDTKKLRYWDGSAWSHSTAQIDPSPAN